MSVKGLVILTYIAKNPLCAAASTSGCIYKEGFSKDKKKDN